MSTFVDDGFAVAQKMFSAVIQVGGSLQYHPHMNVVRVLQPTDRLQLFIYV